MDITIRDFVAADRAAYLGMSQVFYSSKAVMHTIPQAHFERTFSLCLQKDPYVRGLMILVDGQVAGYALLSFTYSNEAGGLSILLEEIYIKEAFQGKGLGSAAFQLVEKEYVETGKAKRLRLEVTKSNGRAIQLYERQGFQSLDYVQMIRDVD